MPEDTKQQFPLDEDVHDIEVAVVGAGSMGAVSELPFDPLHSMRPVT